MEELKRKSEASDIVPLSMGSDRPYPQPLPDIEAFVVDFEGENDPWKPLNWSSWRKFFISVVVCWGTFVASFNSALFAAGSAQASNEFNVSNEVGLLGTSLFVLGFALGPSIWAPSSELIGRRWPLTFGSLGCAIFTIGSAAAKDVQTLIICRFFAGLFGASPLCVAPAVLADMYTERSRGVAISLYALTVFGGPLIASFLGGFIAKSYLGWRWTLYLPAILGFFDFICLLIWCRESFHAIVLADKAVVIRNQTGNWGVHAKQERVDINFNEIMHKYFTRPLKMLVLEPIVLAVSMYMSFIYGLVYALLEAYPYVFGEIRGWSAGVEGLPFIGLLLGVFLALMFIMVLQHLHFKNLAINGNIDPEWRLQPAVPGSFAFAIGLFWFAWTAYDPSIHWMAPTASGVLTGFGILSIFLPCFLYLVDAYLPMAASVVAANVLLRSAIAAGFPLFSRQMFANLGTQWAGTLLGCLAVIMLPIPVILKMFGSALRSKSRML